MPYLRDNGSGSAILAASRANRQRVARATQRRFRPYARNTVSLQRRAR